MSKYTKIVIALALVVVWASLIALVVITQRSTQEALEEIQSIEREQQQAQARSDVAAAERQQIVTDLECYADNSTEFYLIVSDLLIFNLSVDLAAPTVTPEQEQAAQAALERLQNFKDQAASEQLECQEG